MKCSISLAGRGIQKMGLLIFFLAVFAVFIAQPLSAREYDLRRPLAHVQPSNSSPSGDEDPFPVVSHVKPKESTPQPARRALLTNLMDRLYNFVVNLGHQFSTSQEIVNDIESTSTTAD